RRPLVTLSYAQSVDGKIAGPDGQQLRLSGNQSMKMTHILRLRHDGILVGIGTLIKDDPQLTARNLSFPIDLDNQPQPIVLDSCLRTPIDCKLISNYQNGIGKQPWLICGRSTMSISDRHRLEDAGARVIPITNAITQSKTVGHSLLDLEKVFEVLKLNGINRLMIEGGSKIISSCLNQNQHENSLVDVMIVTVSPYMVGQGISINSNSSDSLSLLRHIETKIMGSDAVFAYTTNS
ncbi:dihydrofolate reductase-like domain-containing protein, partial [Phakopsora pachyrhizi]